MKRLAKTIMTKSAIGPENSEKEIWFNATFKLNETAKKDEVGGDGKIHFPIKLVTSFVGQ